MLIEQELGEVRAETAGYLEKAVSELEALVNLTEEKYAYIYDTLPVMEEEIKSNMRESQILLEYLIFKEQEGLSDIKQSVTVDALNRIQQEFEEVAQSFLNEELIEVLLKTFLDKSGEDEQSFSEMGRLVGEVSDTLADLRDLALNSIIFSIRVGDEGAGFRILAERINQISSSLGDEFSHMNRAMKELDEWNQDFQQKLVDFIEYEKNLKTKYQDKFNEEFLKIKKVLKTTCGLLINHHNNVETVIRQVPEAMVLVQNQDIIRQNIENLIKCLKIVLQKKELLYEDNRDEVLNYIVFAKKVGELAPLLLSNIENGVEESLLALEEVLKQIYDQVGNLELDTQYLGAFLAGTDEEVTFDFNVLKDVFTTVMGQVVDLLYIRRHLETKSDFLLEVREVFDRLMEKVEGDFAAIDREIKTLKKMKVLIKIELSRIAYGNNNSMQNIVGAVEQVVSTVYNNQLVFNKLKNHFLKNMNDFNKALEETQVKLEGSAEALEASKRRLVKAKDLVSGAVEASVKETGIVFSELKKPYINIQVQEQVDAIISGVRHYLQYYEDFIRGKEKALFEYYGVEKWEEKEEDLNALLEQFTCFVERKSATALFDEYNGAVDDHSSEIVLF